MTQFFRLFSEESSVVLKDEKEKLIHPGEYEKFKEESCEELLKEGFYVFK